MDRASELYIDEDHDVVGQLARILPAASRFLRRLVLNIGWKEPVAYLNKRPDPHGYLGSNLKNLGRPRTNSLHVSFFAYTLSPTSSGLSKFLKASFLHRRD